jgi:hypothetical protein
VPSFSETASMFASSNKSLAFCAVNRTVFPPGKTCGKRWLISSLAGFVTERSDPPEAGIISRPPTMLRLATISPFSPQLAPPKALASEMVTGAPPWSETFFSLLSAQNPIDWPSGDVSSRSVPTGDANRRYNCQNSRREPSHPWEPRLCSGVNRRLRFLVNAADDACCARLHLGLGDKPIALARYRLDIMRAIR